MSETLKPGMSVTDWAHEHGTPYRWRCAIDNYNMTRNWAHGVLYLTTGHDGEPVVIIGGGDFNRDVTRALFLLDDGRTIRPMYVAGYGPDAVNGRPEAIILQDFPTNYHADGTRRVRADDGRPMDFGLWELGPRTAYHLKLTDA